MVENRKGVIRMTPEQSKLIKKALCVVLSWTASQLYEGRRGTKHQDDKETITDQIREVEAILDQVNDVL